MCTAGIKQVSNLKPIVFPTSPPSASRCNTIWKAQQVAAKHRGVAAAKQRTLRWLQLQINSRITSCHAYHEAYFIYMHIKHRTKNMER